MSIDISAWEPVLLHSVEALSADGIQARAEASGLAAEKVEVFGWLLEIAADAARPRTRERRRRCAAARLA